jgi:hypothetical protein
MQVTMDTDIFIVGRLYTGLKRIRGLLMFVSGRDEKAFSGEFVSISRMLMCLRYKERDKRRRGLEYLDEHYRIQGGCIR